VPDIFLHIPKTGGMSVRTALKWIYGPGAVHRLPSDPAALEAWIEDGGPEQVSAGDLVTGHVAYGIHEHLDGPCRSVTILRHPIRRVVSHYYYHRARYPDTRLAALSLTAFLDSDHRIAAANRQVRFLSAADPADDPEAALESAKARIRDDLAAVGLTERLDASLLLFRRRLGWTRPPFYVSRKVNVDRPAVEDLPDDTVEAVRAHNRLDLALYRFAREQFEAAWAAEAPTLERALPRFRRRNRLVQTVAPPLLWLYRTGRSLLRSPAASGSS
jgi:hypothetical protein